MLIVIMILATVIITMIIMNMQNKLYKIPFFSPPDDQFTASPQAAITEPRNHEFQEIPKKVHTPGQERVQTPGNKKSREPPAPQPTPIHKPSMTFMVRNISIGQLVCLCGCAPSQLLHTCTSAEDQKLEKVPDL